MFYLLHLLISANVVTERGAKRQSRLVLCKTLSRHLSILTSINSVKVLLFRTVSKRHAYARVAILATRCQQRVMEHYAYIALILKRAESSISTLHD